MSLRRVDDDDASAPSSIGAAIGALADRLPVATRLNHVLTIGAKFRLEQQSKQQQLRSQQRKPVSTDAYRRGALYRPNPSPPPTPSWEDDWVNYSSLGPTLQGACQFNPTPLFKQHFDAYVAAINAWRANLGNPNLQWDVIKATMVLAAISNTLKKVNFLREEDCYVVLNFMVNAINAGTISHDGASFMMRESLHHDKFDLAPAEPRTKQGITNEVTTQCKLSQMYLFPHDSRFACNVDNYPAFADPYTAQKTMDWNMCERDILGAEAAADDAEAANAAAAAAAAAELAAAAQMQPQYQQMAGPGAFNLYRP